MPSATDWEMPQPDFDLTTIAKAASIARILNTDVTVDTPSLTCLDVPRRRHKPNLAPGAPSAQLIAQILYPDLAPLPALIKYEQTIVTLRRKTLDRLQQEELARKEAKGYTHRERVRHQGKWTMPDGFYDSDYVEDPTDWFGRSGGPALPMPVAISDRKTLEPFFDYLKSNQAPTLKPEIVLSSTAAADSVDSSSGSEDISTNDETVFVAKPGQEPYYGVDMLEFEKGVVYTDHRMDLCKMVVGPHHIKALMQSLESNSHVKHFLLGNNIIGSTGANAIAEFIRANPEKIETWYLAGNMIDANGLKAIVDAAAGSPVIHSVWLKRNPLGFESAALVLKLIVSCSKLRVLDIEQTQLSDDGIAYIFRGLHDALTRGESISLETIYLNSTGVSDRACRAIAAFLSHPACRLSSLYLANSPIGDLGAKILAPGLQANTSLRRLTLKSCAINSTGAIAVVQALNRHPTIITLDLGQSFSTKDLRSRWNFIEDAAIPSLTTLLSTNPNLRSLSLGTSGLTPTGLSQLNAQIATSNLFHYNAQSCFGREGRNPAVQERLHANVERELGIGYPRFQAEELRWLISPRDVRFIDSVYRNRDAGLARRNLMVLKKDWDVGDETMREVLEY